MEKQLSKIIIFGVATVFLLVILRAAGPFFFRLLWMAVLVGVLAGIFYLVRFTLASIKENKFRKTIEGQISVRLDQCEAMLERNDEEVRAIKEEIKELEASLRRPGLTLANRQETEMLIAGFREEQRLRDAKRDFFISCQKKLGQLLQNHYLAQKLIAKKARLEQFREDKYENLAELEEFRYTIESEVVYLKTIQELSSRMEVSTSIEQASTLQRELEKMTEQLRGL